MSFSERGLTSLADKRLGKHFTFSSDRFLIAINGRTFDSTQAKMESITPAEGKLTYSYQVPGFNIKVVYTLDRHRYFLSKQLEIHPHRKAPVHVDRLVVWDIKPGENLSAFYIPHTRRPELKTGDYGAFLRFQDATGLVMTVQNPFLQFKKNQGNLSLEYEPGMTWKRDDGPFKSDIGNIGGYALTGVRVPAKLIPEWKWTNGIVAITDEEQDQAEVEAFTTIVSAFVLPHLTKSIKMNVGWCENDYQIDVSTPGGRSEYKRIIDQTAAMGMDHILFTPSNADLGSREEATDDWGWENLLWLGLGIQIRKGEWNVDQDPMPAS
ncbi:MAG: hypothetical protein WKF89_11270, partial [Chitinophagaceae bacterium]